MPIAVIFERGEVVEREFRKNHSDRWNRQHPTNIGLIVVAKPVYSTDGSAAGVLPGYHFLSGLGGGGSFCFLQRDGDTWRIQWEDVIWFE